MKLQWMLAFILACAGEVANGEPLNSDPTTKTHITLRVNSFMDMHYFVRDIASRENAVFQKVQGIDKAVETVRKVGDELGNPTAWGFVEGSLASCESVKDAAELVAKLPPNFNTRDGREIPVRGLIQRIVRAYEPLEPAYMQDIWPAHRKAIDEARHRIEKELLPAQAACFVDILRRLNMKDPEIEIPVCLVAKAPFPQGFTHRQKGGGAVCIIGVEGLSGSTMCEVVLHECIHALDIATEQSGSALQELRAMLYRYKVKARSTEFHDIPHTLIFVQAAETVRAVIDPSHKAYGDTAGYYAKLPAISDVVKKAWKAHAEGSLGRDEALIQIARDATHSN
ncbi:MAG: hypothetical protein HZA51_07580 [Planctomycetes bacterium]|nr:hypothetical protein [Planctomycetota bacterium]